jgi:hypothetical protein
MSATLMSHRHVSPGFEVVIGDNEICPGSPGGIWNLWWNVQLSDDPEAWDGEIRSLNEMQSRLGDLTDDQRLIRAQMAEFCRESPLFPESVAVLCEETGEGRFSRPLRMGCEGRRLLDSLGYSVPPDQVPGLLSGYTRSLRRWLEKSDPSTPQDFKISGFLGPQTDGKKGLVVELLGQLESGNLSFSNLRDWSRGACSRGTGESVLDWKGRPFNCFECPAAKTEEDNLPDCTCCLTMIIDAVLICQRGLGDLESMLSELRRFREEYVLACASAINSWLGDSTPTPVTSLTEARYVSVELATSLNERVWKSLGQTDEPKTWLAGCLLKTLKSNQRWHEREELIDGFPGATSWLSKVTKAS